MAQPPFRAHSPGSLKLGRSVGDEIEAIAIHPDGSVIAIVYDGDLTMVPFPAMEKPRGKKERAAAAAYSPDGSVLITLKGTDVSFRDPVTGALRKQVKSDNGNEVHSLAFSPDGQRVVVGEGERALVFDVASGKKVLRFPVFDRVVPSVAWTLDGTLIAARMCEDAGVFDAKTGKMLAALPGLFDERAPIAFLPDGGVITAIDRTTLGVWKRGAWKTPAKRIPTRDTVRAFAISARPPFVLAYADSDTIQLLGPALEPLATLAKLETSPAALAITPDGNVLVAGIPPKLNAWRRAGAPLPAVPGGAAKPAKSASRPPDVETLITPSRKSNIEVAPAKVAWLSRLGKPLPPKTKAKQLASLAKWPGPEHEGVGALIELLETLESELTAAAKNAKVKSGSAVYKQVFALAASKVPYDKEADWAEPASAAAYMVATIAQLVATYGALEQPIPADVQTLWAWCKDGHWPCGFTRKPGKNPVELLVL